MEYEKLRFTKMHGAGNDYIYINGFNYAVSDPSALAIKLSNRHFGIGSDGLVLILPSETCDFRMRMFNADGSEAQMCGNASRCIGKYVYENGLTTKTELTLETLAGQKTLFLSVDHDGLVQAVTVNMGHPHLVPAEIPVLSSDSRVVDLPLSVANQTLRMTCVGMGNPHAVFFVPDMTQIDVHGLGAILEKHPLFPEHTNVEFAQVLSRNELQMRVWERGTGETMACGTGACATAVAAALNHFCESETTLHLLGGDLHINWKQDTNEVFLTGPAAISFEGEMALPAECTIIRNK